MDTACHRFFDIPELLAHLASILESPELATLCRCNREFNSELTPQLYRNLYISGSYTVQGQSMLAYMPWLVAIGRNIHHTRTLGIGPVELVFYYNCILAFEGLQRPHSDSPATSSSLYRWLPPADPRTSQVLPVAPATNLQRLCLTELDRCGPWEPAGVDNDQARLAIFCWLISLNPRLRYLKTHYEPIMDLTGCRLLAKAIFGLSELTVLDLTLSYREDLPFQFGATIFFHCCPSIRKFKLAFREEYDKDDEDTWWKLGDVAGDTNWMIESKKQEPLPSLEELSLWYFTEEVATDEILSIFARCPNIKNLEIPLLFDDCDHDAIGKFIGKVCPQLRSLCCGSTDEGTAVDGPLALRIMEALPAQQLENMTFYGMVLTDGTASILLGPILEECVNLKVLDIPYNRYQKTGLYTTLADLLERPWNCTKLDTLTLSITGCELPVDPKSQPYYTRPAPIELSQVETDHFARLEEFYRRLGTLTKLEYLHLEMVTLDAESQMVTTKTPKCFPALISLGDPKTGRPGYLRLLGNLTKLRHFRGSIKIRTFHVRTLEEPHQIFDDEDDDDEQYEDPQPNESMIEAREKSLMNLEELDLWHIEEDVPIDDIPPIFTRCPNVRKLEIPALPDTYKHDVIGEFIGKKCSKIRQLEEVLILGEVISLSELMFTRPILRYSRTLRECCIFSSGPIARISVSAIFEECVNLSQLIIDCRNLTGLWTGLFVTLSDLLECPWNLSKLNHLHINISGSPVALSQAETNQFALLEELYRRVGTLTELESLHLEMLTLNLEGDVDAALMSERRCFPGILSLYDPEIGRPGYLSHLAGLKKLQHLDGTISGERTEFHMTMGWEEYRWIDRNWPLLMLSRFVGYEESSFDGLFK
ncbi:hypothetical protein BGW39_003714 [Mortierella sp. 14UC]|nr:hypothetical protein BGW39_003714 [Mortierella sp. 14UC]